MTSDDARPRTARLTDRMAEQKAAAARRLVRPAAGASAEAASDEAASGEAASGEANDAPADDLQAHDAGALAPEAAGGHQKGHNDAKDEAKVESEGKEEEEKEEEEEEEEDNKEEDHPDDDAVAVHGTVVSVTLALPWPGTCADGRMRHSSSGGGGGDGGGVSVTLVEQAGLPFGGDACRPFLASGKVGCALLVLRRWCSEAELIEATAWVHESFAPLARAAHAAASAARAKALTAAAVARRDANRSRLELLGKLKRRPAAVVVGKQGERKVGRPSTGEAAGAAENKSSGDAESSDDPAAAAAVAAASASAEPAPSLPPLSIGAAAARVLGSVGAALGFASRPSMGDVFGPGLTPDDAFAALGPGQYRINPALAGSISSSSGGGSEDESAEGRSSDEESDDDTEEDDDENEEEEDEEEEEEEEEEDEEKEEPEEKDDEQGAASSHPRAAFPPSARPPARGHPGWKGSAAEACATRTAASPFDAPPPMALLVLVVDFPAECNGGAGPATVDIAAGRRAEERSPRALALRLRLHELSGAGLASQQEACFPPSRAAAARRAATAAASSAGGRGVGPGLGPGLGTAAAPARSGADPVIPWRLQPCDLPADPAQGCSQRPVRGLVAALRFLDDIAPERARSQ